MRVDRATRCCAVCVLVTSAFAIGSGAHLDARQGAPATADERREVILRRLREARPAPLPLLAAQRAWMLNLPTVPSAPGVMDRDRIYIPLRQDRLVALARETGLVDWTRAIEIASPIVVENARLFAVSGSTIRALDAATGEDLWTAQVAAAITAPLVWDSGWLIAIVEPGEVLAFRAADGALIWRRGVGAPSLHPAARGGRNALYLSLTDGRVVALGLEGGEPLWEQKLPGTLSEPAVGRGRVFVGSTDNFFYAFDDDSGRLRWKWRNGGDVIGAAVDGDVVYFASLDNTIRAVNRGNGNERWRKPTGTRPVLPPRAFGRIVVLTGLTPAITVFVGETGDVMGTQAAAGNLIGGPLVDSVLTPFRVALVTITREGVVEALRPTGVMFREAALVPIATAPGRALARERLP